jgi:hypothetical protein
MQMTTTSRPAYDFKAMVQSLIEPFTTNAEWFEECRLMIGCDDGHYLKEFKTVGIAGPRQCGKTKMLMELFSVTPDSLYVVPNLPLKNALIGWATNPVSERGYGLTIPVDRVVTSYDIKQAINAVKHGGEDTLPKASTIFVDSPYGVFSELRKAKFYNWLAERGGHKQIIITIE